MRGPCRIHRGRPDQHHAVPVQENGTQVRYGRTPEDLNVNYLPALRANLQESWDVFAAKPA